MLYFTLSSITIAVSSIIYLYSSYINPVRVYIPEIYQVHAEEVGQVSKNLGSSITNTDRLAYETKSHNACIRLLLSPEEYDRLRYHVPINSDEQKELSSLAERTRSCWSGSSESEPSLVGARGVNAQIPVSPLDKESCLITAIGKQVNDDIISWKREPKYNEYSKFYECYGRVKPETITYQNQDDFIPEVVESCLRRISSNSYADVIMGRAELSSDRQEQIDACFGVERKPFNRSVNYKVSDVVFQCLSRNIGVDRISGMLKGSMASLEEKKSAAECFLHLNKYQSFFLPIPLEQIPFIEEKSDILRIVEAKQMPEGPIQIVGNAPPDSKVAVYIFPDPITLVTQADEKGSWTYTIEQPLQNGEHVIYASVKSVGSGLVFRSVGHTFVSSQLSTTGVSVKKTTTNKDANISLHQTVFMVMITVFVILAASFIIFSSSR